MLLIVILTIFPNVNAQINTNANTIPAVSNSNLFLDASNFEGFADQSVGRGLGFPRTNLTSFAFDLTVIDEIAILSDFDGMVVYNNATGTTGNTPATQGQQVAVTPGFYYFSNPGNPGNVTDGQWIRLGTTDSGVKSKTVVGTATGTSATLSLGTFTAGEVTKFLGAKIYNAAGTQLIMTADNEYLTATNVLTTANGFIAQALPAGTYSVIVEYE